MRVIAIPRNGLGNRLQMLSSSDYIAEGLGTNLEVIWTHQAVFPSDYSAVFKEIEGITFLNSANPEIRNFRSFTNHDVVTNTITMKNLRAGDQIFIPKLREFLDRCTASTTLLIESGEKFWLKGGRYFSDSNEFRIIRKNFYQRIVYSDAVKKLVQERSIGLTDEYWAVHLRETDRLREALPIERVVKAIISSEGIHSLSSESVYIASDNEKRGMELKNRLHQLGIKTVFHADMNRDRLSLDESVESMADWVLLSRASRIVSYGSTTFSYEAAVAGGTFDRRIHIKDSIVRKTKRNVSKELLNLKLYGKLPYSTKFMRKNGNDN